MPDIAPVLAVTTPAVAAAPAPAGAVTPTAPVAADGSAPDFLGQLKAALKTLAGVVSVLPTAAAPAAALPVVTGDVVPPAAPSASDDAPAAPRTLDHPTDDLADLMVALGFIQVPVPVPVQAPVTPAPSDTATTDVEKVVTPAAGPLTAPAPTPSTATVTTRSPGDVDSVGTVEPEATVADTTPAAMAPAAPAPIAQHAVTSTSASVSPTSDTTHTMTPAATPDTATADAATTAAVADSGASIAPAQPVAHQPQAPTTPAPGAPAVQPHQAMLQNGSAFGQQHGNADHRNAAHDGQGLSGGSSVSDVSNDVTTSVADQTFAAAAANATGVNTPNANAMTPNVHPGEVVAQIAHQADLFRLPGNRGVRIQLHPEDLGGVQVTVRYGTTGGLELHINVEHAATGSLVEAGWTQLRDALATQGISPDRLVMSITSPSGATQMDFSSNSNGSGSGSFRSDQGLASFTQGGQSGQRDGTAGDEASFATRRWTGGPDPVSTTDDSPRAASSAAASRIDYRV